MKAMTSTYGRSAHLVHARGTLPLSPSELAVLRLVAADLTNAEIALRLGKRPATVKLQVAAIIHKLGVSSRVGAAVWYVGSHLD